MVEAVLDVARSEGLILSSEKDAKISVRIHRKLLEAAKYRTGVSSETALVEYALAKVAIEENYGERTAYLTGSVGKDVDLEF
jgi:hypothetical protein